MNAALDNLHPLPTALMRNGLEDTGRRHAIDGHEIDTGALDAFNALLLRLDRGHPTLGRDQLVTAARELSGQTEGLQAAPCIHERMRRAGAIDLMLHDHDWEPEDIAVAPAELVIDYVRAKVDLIPDTLPRVGRLDDALVVEAGWRSLAPEVRNYLDFCRLRQVEREMGNRSGFNRSVWVEARQAEVEWLEHCRRVGGNSYLTQPPGHFKVC